MNKKETVIEKARELFTKYGYKRVSMDEIASDANVTKKTIYTYFKDKDELFRYFINEELEVMKNEIEKEEQEKLPLFEKVAKSIYYMLTFRKNSLLFTHIIKEKDSLKSSDFLELYDNEILNYIEDKIKKEIALKNIKICDAHLTAFIIYKVCIALMFEYDKELDEEKVTKEITFILKEGLLN